MVTNNIHVPWQIVAFQVIWAEILWNTDILCTIINKIFDIDLKKLNENQMA